MSKDKLRQAIESFSPIKGLTDALGVKEFAYIPVEEITTYPQIRDTIDISSESFLALKSSISKEGLLEPVIVLKEKDHYRLIAGHRRLLACKELNMQFIPCKIIDRKLSDAEILGIQLIENLQREDLDPIEESKAYLNFYKLHTGKDLNSLINDLMLYKLSPERLDSNTVPIIGTLKEISGKSISYLQNALLLLTLPENIQKAIKDGRLQVTAGYRLAYKREHPEFEKICEDILKADSITVQDIERFFKVPKKSSQKSKQDKKNFIEIPSYLWGFIDTPEEILSTFIKHYPRKIAKARFKGLRGETIIVVVKNKEIRIKDKSALKFIKHKLQDPSWDRTVTIHINGIIS